MRLQVLGREYRRQSGEVLKEGAIFTPTVREQEMIEGEQLLGLRFIEVAEQGAASVDELRDGAVGVLEADETDEAEQEVVPARPVRRAPAKKATKKVRR